MRQGIWTEEYSQYKDSSHLHICSGGLLWGQGVACMDPSVEVQAVSMANGIEKRSVVSEVEDTLQSFLKDAVGTRPRGREEPKSRHGP